MMRTLNLAHRGFSGDYPENTMPAFEAAAGLDGCDGIELDVQLTSDGEVVICHDELIDRTCTSGQKGLIRDYTLRQLQAMDFAYKHPELAGQCPMPTLREYLAFMQDKPHVTNIELKTGIIEYPDIEQKVWDLICEFGMQDRIIISSFNHYSVLRMKKICPQIPCGLLSDTWILNAGAYVKQAGCEFYHPHFFNVTPAIAAEIAPTGIGINTWTVNRTEDIERMLDLKVSAIIGNHPDRVARIMRARGILPENV